MEQNEKLKKNISGALIDWSKWLIGINFSAATGCVIVFKDLDEDKLKAIGLYLFGAIISFILCVFMSVVLTYSLSIQTTDKPKPSHLLLSKIQFLFFVVGLIFLCVWIFKKIP